MKRKAHGLLLKKMLREQLLCIGRIAVRHHVPDKVIWDIVKDFDLIYLHLKREAENRTSHSFSNEINYKPKPHAGIMYLLEKIEK